jgi:peroxiredoxin
MTEPLSAGATAPDFTLPSTKVTLARRHARERDRVVGCSSSKQARRHARDADHDAEGRALDCRRVRRGVIAVSAASLAAQEAVAERLDGLLFPLASDADLTAARDAVIDESDTRRSRRAVFVRDGTILHANFSLSAWEPLAGGGNFAVLNAE